VERDLIQQSLHDRVEAPRPDVLRARVHLHRDLRDRLHRVRREPERHLLRSEELGVLRDQRVLRFRQDADEILARQGVELDADRKASLELRDEVRGLRDVEGAAAMNRTWSVRTIPYLVVTAEPSTMGSRSRWTPSRETSGPWPASRPAILSSSSRKMIPAFSARRIACATTCSMSTSFCASS